jgi:hypothetical protein
MKRLRLVLMTLALSAAGCGGVKTGSSADAGPDGDHRADDGGTNGGGTDDGGPDDDGPDDAGPDGEGPDAGGSASCVLGTSRLGNCNL